MTSTLRRATAVTVLLAAGVAMASAGTVRLTGKQETPPVKTMARGAGVIDVAADGSITGKINTHGIEGTLAHIHEGAPGRKGPAVMALAPGPRGTWVVPAGSKLTPQQRQEFLAGKLYVNVHSATHPDGEIRGQLKP
ncbi:MAG: CHRD domain-containing protein [Steroidobacteraceae bacterium]